MTNQINFRAKSFMSEQNTSSIAYEVKRTRAVFDDSLAIPGTNRRGGWRCPPGTRYGGQITDRFGRNCGWGVSRRLANEISDLGERLESVGDRRQRRREQRGAARSQRGPGMVERAAGRLANALESDSVVETPKPNRQRKGPARRRPNLRNSEQRRMDREIEQPGALRTDQGRRRRATADVVERPRPDAPVAKPAKKAPAKKAAAKKAPAKKAPAKKRVAKKAAVKKSSAPRAEAEPKLSPQRPPKKAPAAPNSVRERIQAAGFLGVDDRPLDADEMSRFAGVKEEVFNEMQREISLSNDLVLRDMDAWGEANIEELRGVVKNQDRYVSEAATDLQNALDRMRTRGPGADDEEFENLQSAVVRANADYARAINRREAFTNRLTKLSGRAVPEAERPNKPSAPSQNAAPPPPPLDARETLRRVFNGRSIGYERDFEQEFARLRDENIDFDNMTERVALSKIEDYDKNIGWNQDYFNNLSNLDPNQELQLPNRVVKAGELKDEVEKVLDQWKSRRAKAEDRLQNINRDRLPGLAGARALNGQDLSGYQDKAAAKSVMARLSANNPEMRFSLIDYQGKFFVVNDTQLASVMNNGGIMNPNILEKRGGLPLAAELPEVDAEVARKAAANVDAAIKKRQKILADYLNQRYGEGNSPWKEMTSERREELVRLADRGDADAQNQLIRWATEMYKHDEIKGVNGKTYRTVPTVNYYGNGTLSVGVVIQRQSNGRWNDVGTSSRTIYAGENPPKVYNSTMFINVAADKNSGIQTIYNQHAFMYAKAAGFKQFSVSAVDDGRFVWGKIGFRQRIDQRPVAQMFQEVAKFRDGSSSLIKNESDARIIEHLVQQYVRNPDNVRHIDFVTAISNTETGAAKKTRDKEIMDWFKAYMPFGGGAFDLDENKIVADPRERN
jgi:hypothetical protein